MDKEDKYWEEKTWPVDKDWPVDKWEQSHQEQWQGPADKETVEEGPVDQEGPPWPAWKVEETDQHHTVPVKTAAPWCQEQHNTDQYHTDQDDTCYKAGEPHRALQHRQAAMEHAQAAEWHAQAAEWHDSSSAIEPGTEAWLRRDVLTVDEWNYWKEGLQVGNTLC